MDENWRYRDQTTLPPVVEGIDSDWVAELLRAMPEYRINNSTDLHGSERAPDPDWGRVVR
jgi:hypothetical protein